MKTLRCMLMLMAVTGLMIALVGCGVSEDEHQKVVSDLSETKAQLDKANTKIAQLEKSLLAAKGEAKSVVEKPEKVASPTDVDKGLQGKLAAAQEEATNLKSKVASLTKENISLKGLLEKLKEKLAQLESKLKGLQGSSGSVGSDLLKNR
jgi:chromosome segregation ATPase